MLTVVYQYVSGVLANECCKTTMLEMFVNIVNRYDLWHRAEINIIHLLL